MSNLTRKQREIIRILQSEGSYRFRITSLSICERNEIENLKEKGLIIIKYDKSDFSMRIATLTEKGKERKYAIDLVSVYLRLSLIGLFSGVLMTVGIFFGISLITSVGFGILVGTIVFGVMFIIWYWILLVYDGLKWRF